MDVIKNLIRPELLEFSPYSSARDEAALGKVWLNANESPWALDIDDTLNINRYPDKQAPKLIQSLSQIYGVDPEQIAITRGSDEGIDLLTRLFCRTGTDAIMVCPPTFGVYAALQGARVISAPLNIDPEFSLNMELINARWCPEVKLIYLCSPNNPTGNVLAPDDIFALCERYLGRSMIVLDEAYIEFSETSSLAYALKKYPNLVILRTLSKAYGLAGARVGAVLGDAFLVNWIKAIITPYPMPVTSVEAACKALTPSALEKVAAQVQCIQNERTQLSQALKKLKQVEYVWPSSANFLLVKFKNGPRVMQACLNEGIVLRDMSNRPELQNCLRITIGSPEENACVLKFLQNLDN